MSSWLDLLRRRLRDTPSFIRFALVGGTATVVDFSIFNIILAGRGGPNTTHLLAAATLGFVFATYTSYQLNSRFTFCATRSPATLGRYVTIAVGGLLIHNTMLLFLRCLFDPSTVIELNIVKFGALGASMIWNYLGYRHIVFRI